MEMATSKYKERMKNTTSMLHWHLGKVVKKILQFYTITLWGANLPEDALKFLVAFSSSFTDLINIIA